MKQIHDLFYKAVEVWKPLAHGDIITITEPDAVKAPEPEAFKLLMQEPVAFNVKLSKNDCERLRRAFGMKKPQLVGRRIAKRKNRLRRLNDWKEKAAERARFYNLPLAEKYRYLITHAVDTVKNGMIDTVQDCVGLIRGLEWGGYRNE